MLLEDNESITLAHCKFTIAIVLSNLGDNDSARIVLNSFQGSEIDELAKVLGDKGMNSLIGLLQYLWQNPVLSKTTSQNHSTVSQYPLKDIVVSSISASKIYEQCVNIFIKYPVNKLIYLYTLTPLFKNEFLKDFKRKLKNGVFVIKRSLSNQEIEQIGEHVLTAFSNDTEKYYANASYDVRTSTPDKFLFNALNSFFGKESYYNEINTVGLNKRVLQSTESSGVSSMDLASIDMDTELTEFDFIAMASKIYQASAILFNYHNNSSVYYDLVSWFKTKSIANILEKNKTTINHLNSSGISVEVSAGKFDIVTNGNSITQNNKFNARLRICDEFMCMLKLDNLIPPIYTLYKDVLSTNDKLTKKDGARIFSTASHTVKGNLNNGETFKKIYDGFYALRKLLMHLEERKDIDIYSIPVDIFRDYKYLRRFSSLDDYLERYPYVKELLTEEEQNPDISVAFIENGIHSNDDLYDCYSLGGYASTNRIIDYIIHYPIVNLKNAIESECERQVSIAYCDNIEREAEHVLSCIRMSDDFIANIVNASSNSASDNDTVLTNVLISFHNFAVASCKKIVDGNATASDPFIILVAVKYLSLYMEHLGHPLVDSFDQYTMTGINLEQMFDFVESENVRQFCKNILYVADCVISNKEFRNDTDLDWVNVHAIFTATSATLTYTDKIISVLDKLSRIHNDNNVLLISASEYMSVLNVPEEAFSRRDLQLLTNTVWENYQISARIDRDQFLNSIHVDNLYIVRAYNLVMSYFSDTVKVFRDLLLGISETFVGATQTENVSDMHSNTLSIASGSLYGAAEDNRVIATKLEIYETDDLGYLKHGNTRVHNGNQYYHKLGYIINVEDTGNEFTIKKMGDTDIYPLEFFYDYGYFS